MIEYVKDWNTLVSKYYYDLKRIYFKDYYNINEDSFHDCLMSLRNPNIYTNYDSSKGCSFVTWISNWVRGYRTNQSRNKKMYNNTHNNVEYKDYMCPVSHIESDTVTLSDRLSTKDRYICDEILKGTSKSEIGVSMEVTRQCIDERCKSIKRKYNKNTLYKMS